MVDISVEATKKRVKEYTDDQLWALNDVLEFALVPSTPEEELYIKTLREEVPKEIERRLAYSGDWKDFEDTENKYPSVAWRINGKLHKFQIVGRCDFPKGAKLVKEAVFEDHLEQLWKLDDKWYRYAGGGRGFYWTQLLELVE